jgi:hypothetical protein
VVSAASILFDDLEWFEYNLMPKYQAIIFQFPVDPISTAILIKRACLKRQPQ